MKPAFDLVDAAARNYALAVSTVQLLHPHRAHAQAKAEALRESLERANETGSRVQFVRSLHHVPGFFPTPPALVERMIDAAELAHGMACLEPSAGTGNIAKAMLRAGISPHALQCVEVVPRMVEALTRDGLATRCADFLAYEVGQQFDRVLMNPPFEKRQDEAHIRHAFGFLRPGGRLVAICSSMTALRLADWVRGRGHIEPLPEGSFKNSERSTGVHVSMIVINN